MQVKPLAFVGLKSMFLQVSFPSTWSGSSPAFEKFAAASWQTSGSMKSAKSEWHRWATTALRDAQTSWHWERQMPLDTLACSWHLSMHPAAPSLRWGRLIDPKILDKSDPTWHAPAIAFLHPTRSVPQPIPISTSPDQRIAKLRNMLYKICSLVTIHSIWTIKTSKPWIELMIQEGLPNRLTFMGSVLPSRISAFPRKEKPF